MEKGTDSDGQTDDEHGTLTLIEAKEGRYYVIDADGKLWRMYWMIEGTKSVDLPEATELFRLCGSAFGKFRKEMIGFDASVLHETIVDFHYMPACYEQLEDAVARDKADRAVAFCEQYVQKAHVLMDGWRQERFRCA